MSMMQDPAARAAAVTPNDSTLLAGVRGLYVGGAGNLALKTKASDTAVTFVAVPAGALLPVRATQVMSTNTTATSIVALY